MMTSTVKFWDRIAAKYARTPVPDEQVYQKKLQITRSYFSPQMRILEFGCGTGSTAIAHAPYVEHIHAIDFSANMLEIARAKLGAGKINNIVFEQQSITSSTSIN